MKYRGMLVHFSIEEWNNTVEWANPIRTLLGLPPLERIEIDKIPS